jgi:lycopene cyclase domain-containing protein
VTYWALNAVFLGLVALVALAAVLFRRPPRWSAVALAAIPLLLLTAIFDNVLVAAGIVAYDPDLISGILVGLAPLEDFCYPLAAVVLLPSVWSLLGPRATATPGSTR